jgi:pimeloyl-ACP methyl ester carboxylesterase
MPSSTSAPLDNSTNGRTLPLTVRAVRTWFRVAAAVAPRTAERQAASLFLTPTRKRRKQPRLEDPSTGRYALTVREGELQVAAWSWGSGPAVLLAHGWGGCAADMAPLAEELERAGYRAVLFDFPAHGRSLGKRTNMVEWLRVMRAVVATVGTLHAVVGHSFGAATLAVALAEHGMDVRGAVLLAPVIGPTLFVERFTGMIGLPAARADGMMRHIARTVGREPSTLDARRAAASLRVPALIMHDPEDREVPWAHGAEIANAWIGSRLLQADGLGHTRLLRDPVILATAVEFINDLARQPAPLAVAS